MTLLGDACSRGDYNLARSLIVDDGHQPNEYDDIGVGPLFVACREGRADCVRLLVDHGADLQGGGYWEVDRFQSMSPLRVVCAHAHSESLKIILEAGVGVDHENPLQAVCVAFEHGKGAARCVDCVKLLCEHGVLRTLHEDRAYWNFKVPVCIAECVDDYRALHEEGSASGRSVKSRLQRTRAARKATRDQASSSCAVQTVEEFAHAEALAEAAAAALLSEETAEADEAKEKKDKKKKKKKQPLAADVAPTAAGSMIDAADALRSVDISNEAEPENDDTQHGAGIGMHEAPPSLIKEVVPLSMAKFDTGRDIDESTMGGGTTCSVCFEGVKTHLAVPCGHLCACEGCAGLLASKGKCCPICRGDVAQWIKLHVA